MMKQFCAVYVPVGVPTFHMESAGDQFHRSVALLKQLNPEIVCPEEMLLSIEAMRAYLEQLEPDLIIFQNLTFANSAYISGVMRESSCPVVIWTLREPVIDGGRLRLNSLTGAFSAANAMHACGKTDFAWVYGAPEEEKLRKALLANLRAAALKKALRNLKLAAIGQTPQGFGFGRSLDSELQRTFGVELDAIEVRELIDRAKGYTDAECAEYLQKTERATCGLAQTPERNRLDHARVYRAYMEYIHENQIGAIASRCWPDFFTEYGTPVCAVLSMINDEGVAAACETDVCGALSMWMGMQLTGKAVFFGDPVSLDEQENTLTFWHCGMAPCSMARKDTGAEIGVHPNRKIGPAMNFGCEAFGDATIFRVGRESDGSFRFFVTEGRAMDKPRQFLGTSLVVRLHTDAGSVVEQAVQQGFEPHYAVMQGACADTLECLAAMLGIPVLRL